MALAQTFVALGGVYFGIGIAFALAFVTIGVGRIDPGAAAGTRGFRAMILPGAAALWPLLARRWLAARRVLPEQHDAHTDASRRGGAA